MSYSETTPGRAAHWRRRRRSASPRRPKTQQVAPTMTATTKPHTPKPNLTCRNLRSRLPDKVPLAFLTDRGNSPRHRVRRRLASPAGPPSPASGPCRPSSRPRWRGSCPSPSGSPSRGAPTPASTRWGRSRASSSSGEVPDGARRARQRRQPARRRRARAPSPRPTASTPAATRARAATSTGSGPRRCRAPSRRAARCGGATRSTTTRWRRAPPRSSARTTSPPSPRPRPRTPASSATSCARSGRARATC